LLIILTAVIAVLRFLISESVVFPVLHSAFSVRHTAIIPNVSLISLLCIGSSFFKTAFEAESYASSPYRGFQKSLQKNHGFQKNKLPSRP
jgi:hypothetical protein